MARQNVQVVPLDLRGGVVTNETALAIGPRLRMAQNCGWQPFRSTSDLRRRSLGMLPMPSDTPLYTLVGGSHNEAGHVLGILFNDANRGVIVSEEIATGHLLVNREIAGTLITDTGNALALAPDYQTAPIADWPAIATPRTYLSHPNLLAPETYQWDGTTFAPYTPANGPGSPYADNAALNPTLSAQVLTGSEVALPAGDYLVILYAQGAPLEKSLAQTVTLAAARVLQILTPGVVGAHSLYDIYVTAAGQPLETARLQRASAAAATTYRLSTSGTPAANTPITFTAAGAAQPSLFKGNSALIVHLDRLWLAKQQLTAAGRPRTLVWYTDPLDPTTVRATNFVDILDYVTCLFRASSSPIDIGAAAHLCFGAHNSVWVLDGDPTQGNAVLRRLVFGIGIADASCVAATPYGAVVLATDGQFYLIPPGAQEMVPIGSGNRDQAALFDVAVFPGRVANASLAWVSPYVYYCPGDINACWVLDFSRGASEPARWWGPLTTFINSGGAWGVRLFSAGVEDGRNGSTKLRIGSTALASIATIYELDVTAEQVANRQVVLRTGAIRVPHHRVKLGRLVLVTTRKSAGTTITVTAYKADGASQTVTLAPKTTALTPTKDILAQTVFTFDALGVVSEAFYLEIAWPAGIEPDLQDAWLEYHLEAKAA